ncbi:MAG: hypothetical protein J6D08_04195 [Lachnospiraceae bacterium]|nr:hypothetical protein [Lachnospiraceae bacterium]
MKESVKKVWIKFDSQSGHSENEESRLNRDRAISLADAPGCPAAVTAFNDRFWERITGIETVEQRNNILSDMQQYFEKEVRQGPQNRDKLSGVYQLLKQKCWEVSAQWEMRN